MVPRDVVSETRNVADQIKMLCSRMNNDLPTLTSGLHDSMTKIETQLVGVNDRGNEIIGLTQAAQATSLERHESTHELLGRLLAFMEDVEGRRAVDRRELQTSIQLAAKPAILKKICDEVAATTTRHTPEHKFSDSVQAPTRRRKPCVCAINKKRKQYRWAWGALQYFSNSSMSEHASYCPLSLYVPVEQSHETRVVMPYLPMKHVTRAIGLSFIWRSGAGGSSISSSLSTYHIVDAKTSPAFRILGVLHLAAEELSQDERFNDEFLINWNILVHQTTTKLESLFRQGHASPSDVCPVNGSLLHLMADVVRRGLNSPRG